MSFFRRDRSPAPAAGPAEPAARGRGLTTVAVGSRFEGKLSGATDVVVEGEVEGEVRLGGDLVVAAGGKIAGDVEARTVRIVGVVEGNVRGRERVELAATGSLTGDVSAVKVVISEGAFLKGKIEMHGSESGSAPAPAKR